MNREASQAARKWLEPSIYGPRPEPGAEGRRHLIWSFLLPGDSQLDWYLAEYLVAWSEAAGVPSKEILADFKCSLQL
jgi:hypothetical protein